jgi:hypothetical protein
MSLPNKDGTYKARPLEWGVKTDGTPAFVVKYDLLEWFNGTGWEPPGGDYQITGYHYPVKKDGTINETTYKALREALGWDGTGYQSLNDGDYSQVECQVRLGYEEYQGRQQLKVQFINPIDYDPSFGVDKGDPQAVRSLDSQYGSAFRAMAGTTKPAAPARPQRQTAPAPTRAADSGGVATAAPPIAAEAKQQAWKAFIDKTPSYDDQKRKDVFRAAVASLFAPGTDLKALTNQQWQDVTNRIVADFDEAVGDFLPF